jgi:hypothetical protein
LNVIIMSMRVTRRWSTAGEEWAWFWTIFVGVAGDAITVLSILQGAPVGLTIFFAIFCLGGGLLFLVSTIITNRDPVDPQDGPDETSGRSNVGRSGTGQLRP